MCDFHSVIVTGDGRILHNPSNSHSNIASQHGLETGLDAKWWECEWDGHGSMPVNLIQRRGKDTEPTAAAERAAQRHYEKLAQIISGEVNAADCYPFNQPEYADVPAAVERFAAEARLKAERGAKAKLEAERLEAEKQKIAPLVELFDNTEWNYCLIEVMRMFIEQTGLDVEDVAEEELTSLRDDMQSEIDSAFDNGVEAASNELYSWEFVQDEVKSATRELQDKLDEYEETLQEEDYMIGYMDAKRGKPAQFDDHDGIPSFLI